MSGSGGVVFVFRDGEFVKCSVVVWLYLDVLLGCTHDSVGSGFMRRCAATRCLRDGSLGRSSDVRPCVDVRV